MGRVAVRGIRAHLVKFLLSVLAVALGVSFVAGTFSLRTMLSSTFTGIVETTMTGDVYVRGSEASSRGLAATNSVGDVRNPIPLSLVETISDIDGVSAAVPDLSGPIVLVGADGTAVTSTQAPSFASAVFPDDPSVTLVDGGFAHGPREIALEEQTLEYSGLAVGDMTTVVLGGEIEQVEVVGSFSLGGPMAGATIVGIDPTVAESLFAPTGEIPTIAVFADPGVSEATLVSQLSPALPSQAQAVEGSVMRSDASTEIESMLGFISTFLLVFAGISLFVGAFIIANTFSMSVRQRMREFALLRAVGASPLQVFASILLQAGVIGVLGSVVGVLGGFGLVEALRSVFESMGMDLSGRIPLSVSTVLLSVAIGTVVSLVAAFVPARRAALVPPVEALRDDVADQEKTIRVRATIGWLLGGLGLAAVVAALLDPEGSSAETLVALGAVGVVLGMLTLAPVMARAVVGVLAVPFVALLRPVGRLARGNVVRNPRRTASTAGALMIGMALVGGASVIAATTQASTSEIVANDLNADFVVQSATGAVPPQALTELRDLPTVEKVDSFTVSSALVQGPAEQPQTDPTVVAGMDFSAFGTTVAADEVDGRLAEVGPDEVAVIRSTAEARDWTVGDVLAVTTDVGTRDVTVGAIFTSSVVDAPIVMPQELFDAVIPAEQAMVTIAIITDAPGVDLGTARASIVAVAKPYVVVSVLDSDEYASSLADQVNQVLVILYALLGLSIVIAVLGIVNTLALSVIERTREIGLLRAVGLGRFQLAGTVTIESVLTAVFGTVVGVGVGVGLASTLPTIYASDGLSQLSIPWATLVVMLVLAVVVGVVAAIWPATRAARMPVLDAVSYE